MDKLLEMVRLWERAEGVKADKLSYRKSERTGHGLDREVRYGNCLVIINEFKYEYIDFRPALISKDFLPLFLLNNLIVTG
jgi:hypothetical protein